MRGRIKHIIPLLVSMGMLISGVVVYSNYQAQVYRTIESKLMRWADYVISEIVKNPTRFQKDPRRFVFSATANQFTSGTVLVQFMGPEGDLKAKSPSLVLFNLPFTWGEDRLLNDVESEDGTKLKVYQRQIKVNQQDWGYVILGVVVTQTEHNLTFLRNILAIITLITIVILVVLINIMVSSNLVSNYHRFFSFASHELRTPLAIIMGSAEVALKSKDPQEYRMALTTIQDETQLMRRLVSNLLAIFRAQSQVEPLYLSWFYWADIIMDEMSQLTCRYPQKKLTMTIDEASFYADPHQLKQVVRNLLDNACKYTEPDGKIEIVVKTSTRTSTLSVRDNGIGISPAAMSRIFDPYYQVNASSEGVGLGLSIVQSIVKAHAGTLWVNSQLGQGSEFKICIPIQNRWWVRIRTKWQRMKGYVSGGL